MMVITGIRSPEASEVTDYRELSKALKHKHTIHTRQAASKTHTFELEVEVLSRNIIFEGDDESSIICPLLVRRDHESVWGWVVHSTD